MRNIFFSAVVLLQFAGSTVIGGTVQRLLNRDFENPNHSLNWVVPAGVTVLDYVANAPPSWNPGVLPAANGPWGPQAVRHNTSSINVDMTQTVNIPTGIYDITWSGWVRVYDDTAGQSRGRVGLFQNATNLGFSGVDNNAGTITVGDGDPVPGPPGWSGNWTQVSSSVSARSVLDTDNLIFTFRVVSNPGSGWSQVNGDTFSLTTFANDATITGPGPISFGRVMQHQTPTINLNLSKSGSDATTYSAIATVGIGLSGVDGNFATASEVLAVHLQDIAQGSATTGAKSYSVTVDNTATTGVTGSGQGVFDADDVVDVSATVVANRTVSASAVNLGNVIVGATSNSANSSLTTSGDDNNFTRVTVNGTSASDGSATVAAGSGQLFDDAGDTVNRSVSAVFASAGPKAGSVALSVSGEGLTGESVNGVSVAYTANAYDPSSGAFASNSGTTLNVDLGTFVTGSGIQSINDAIYNILQTVGYTAELDFDTISGSGDTGILSTDLGNGEFTALAAGIGNAYAFNMSFDTDNLPGVYNATYELRLSDADAYAGASAAGTQLLTLNLTGTIEAISVPEPASGIMFLMAICASGLALVRSRN